MCENCQSEISDKSLYCPNCGIKIKNKRFLSKIGKKIWIVLTLAIVVIFVGFIGFKKNQDTKEIELDPSEKYVLKCVEILQHEIGNISLENDILYSEKDSGTIYVIIEFSSKAGRDLAYFEDQVFLGTGTDYARIKNIEFDDVEAGRITNSEYMAILEQKISFSGAHLEVLAWRALSTAGSSGSESMHLVSARKIGKKLDISYPKN